MTNPLLALGSMTTSEFCTNLSSMITDQNTSTTMGGKKAARACDSCLQKRARWYCAADDAFLCQGCDASVHSANPLASRHERFRLGTSSFKRFMSNPNNDSMPDWHKGFTRKARTPRQSKKALKHNNKDKGRMANYSLLVPEMEIEELSFEEETEAQLLFRVPILDPFAAELCNVSNHSENKNKEICKIETSVLNESNAMFSDGNRNDEVCELDNLPVFLPSEMELAEFAADVESLLGTGLDDESCRIEGLGLINCKEENVIDDCYEGGRVKTEDNEVEAIIDCRYDSGFDMSKDTIDWNFDYESPVTGDDEVEEKTVVVVEAESMNSERKDIKKGRFLRINFDDVISSWDNKGCPWTSGIRPEINADDCCTDFLGMCAPGTDNWHGGAGRRIGGSDGGREARVSRYREKRRTRLFSKKIRYEVRKLNAEKRPRMKGRFVKRTSFAGASGAAFPYIMSK